MSDKATLLAPIDRFLAKVHPASSWRSCWPWVGATRGSRQARGCFWDGKKNVDAARWIYQHENPSADLDGKVVMHRCDNPLCVNPRHLTLGTQADNVADMHSKRRAHQQNNPAVGVRAALSANKTLSAEPHRRARGERHGMAKISDDERACIQASDEPTSVLAARYGVSRTCIQRIRAAALRARAETLP